MDEQPKIIQYVRKLINSCGLCLLPLVDGEKHHGDGWKQYQSRLPNESEISSWTNKKRWGIVCGRVSGNLEVIDFDEKVRKGFFEAWKSLLPAEALELLKTLPLSKTINNGYHLLYRSKEIGRNTPLARCLDESGEKKAVIETRGEGGFIVEPPTEGYEHLNGSLEHIPEITPEQRKSLWDTARVLNEIVEEQKIFNPKPQLPDSNRPGDDYNTRATWEEILAPLGWKIERQCGEKRYWKRPGKIEGGISATENYNGNGLLHVFSSSTPFEPDRSYTKFSAYAILNHKADFKSAARELANKGYGSKQSEEGTKVAVPHESQSDVIVRMVLARRFWQLRHKAPNTEALKTALTVLEGKAYFDGPLIKLWNRLTEHEGAIWYDLADTEWRAVKITKASWEIVANPPILFRRYSHQKAQCQPVQDGDITLLLKYLNVADRKHRLLLLVWLVASFIPNIPHPILIVYGAQGASKTFFCRLLKKIGDPSEVETIGFPRDQNELVQIFDHHWCIVFDNISRISGRDSDALCKAVTGDGFSKRELFTDDDDIIYAFRRVLILNGINQVATRPDILERGILLELERISEEDRKSEKALLAEFEKDQPSILGGIFTVLQKAMQIEPAIELASLPRMADFTRWGAAIAEALGYTKEEFLSAYGSNIASQNDEVLAENLTAVLLRTFMDGREDWEGTPTELRNALIEVAEGLHIKPEREPDFPKTANALGKKINELKTNLAVTGMHIKRGEAQKQKRIYIRKGGKKTVSVDSVVPSPSVGTAPKQKDPPMPLLLGSKADKGVDRVDDFWNPETF
ncbi:MAG: hypothetical protein UV20_C0014G0002 [Candidatus Magasanikbacteria bacterium GW2011_GWA2_42_32]|uniref:DNA primase/polymerase bifunctional N-terminal domain-containing protein n=1 Tax=Candidatus Magasanikbacteria bacterium GW2011_GWA2_42_32 TaxID=1619039 RepID=A0A0G1A5P8_9BACT|nr:MAG: hypothetical protein UV20_C0014G0002 [Candidatus Magasanikbacteria bacterium GW2011_GWA2_42_32]